jgi:hypothetical protein
MQVTTLKPSVARSLEPLTRLPELGLPGRPVAALVSVEASPSAVPSNVAALALPVPGGSLDEAATTRLLAEVFGSASERTRTLKGASLVVEGLRGLGPTLEAQGFQGAGQQLGVAAKTMTLIVATNEVYDALASEDTGAWERLWKAGKLVIAAGNLATELGDAVPGVQQAAPYLTVIGGVVKLGDGVMLLLRPDDKDRAGGRMPT